MSKRVKEICPSHSITFAQKVQELKLNGVDIIGLNVGELDSPTSPIAIEATYQALLKGKTLYGPVSGNTEVRQLIANKFSAQLDASNVILSFGSKQVLYTCFQALINPGDEVIIPTPYWVSFPESVKLAGGIPKYIEATIDYLPTIGSIKAAITPKTKALIINSPNNPSGAVFPEKLLMEIGELALEHNLFVVSDEAYEAYTFGAKHCSLGLINNMKYFSHTIVVRSFSKTYCMTGFRIGHAIANEKIIADMNKLQGHIAGNVPPFIQEGAYEMLKNGDSFIENTKNELIERCHILHEGLKDIFNLSKPQGAFYLFAEVENLIKKLNLKDDNELSVYLLEKAHVAVLPGSAFGLPNHLRLAFTIDQTRLREAVLRLRRVFGVE